MARWTMNRWVAVPLWLLRALTQVLAAVLIAAGMVAVLPGVILLALGTGKPWNTHLRAMRRTQAPAA